LARRKVRGILLVAFLAGLSGCTNQLPFQEPAAAVVDGHTISIKTYQARLEVSRQRDPLAGLTTSPSSSPSAQRLEDFTIQQLIREEIIRHEADRRKIQISDVQVDRRIAHLRDQAGGTAFAAALGRNGFTAASFRDYQRAFLTEVTVVKVMARERAASAAVALSHGASFIAEASQWSDDTGTRFRGGDVGWLKPTDLPESSLAAAVGLLPTGGRTGIVSTSRGFVIATVLDRQGEQVHLAVILVLAPDADLYTVESRPPWFEQWVQDRRQSLEHDGRIQVRVGSGTRG
jgi:parvulin-like peptidyl-prolyl isomerase